MIRGLWGRKIGMTQIFSDEKVIPVTVIDAAGWYITGTKTTERDGYNAFQVGLLRNRYFEQAFSNDWLKKLKRYFTQIHEIKVTGDMPDIIIGSPASFLSEFAQGQSVDAFGITKGCGFAGVVRRHGFNGPPGSHGAKMGKNPGTLSFMRSQGKVIKGKRLPGHMGVDQRVMRNLDVAKVELESNLLLIKGSIPGKAGSVVFIRKI